MRISGQKTMRVPGPGEATVGLALPPCPVCKTPGVPGEEFCPECGFLVGSTPGIQPGAAETAHLPRLVDEAGREFVLQPGQNVVGRENADVLVVNKTVSRRHAILTVGGDGSVTLEDLKSTNGTRAAGAKVEAGAPVPIRDGAAVQFGDAKFKAVVPGGVAAAPAAGPPLTALPPAEPAAAPRAFIESATPAPAPPAPLTAKLSGAGGVEFALGAAPATFGRRPSSTYVLSGDSYVSGLHASIEQENGRFYLIDKESTNGTRLNGRKIEPNNREPLSEGDEILLGQTPFTFHVNSG